jgi:hypothetical protein
VSDSHDHNYHYNLNHDFDYEARADLNDVDGADDNVHDNYVAVTGRVYV